MTPRFLLDTHILLHWLSGARRLSRDQRRTLEQSSSRGEPLGVSAISLLELAILANDGRITVNPGVKELLMDLEANRLFSIIPISAEVALEAGALRSLRDPADRAIVATARVHGMQLLTSDERIVRTGFARVID